MWIFIQKSRRSAEQKYEQANALGERCKSVGEDLDEIKERDMRHSQHEIVILKPTAVFSSFLTSQLPDVKLPDLRLLQIDNTAYALRKQKTDEETLNEIEKYFSKMFRHEISRWLGDKARHEIENNFLDFLCCFKFELHNHILLLEPSIEASHQLLLIKPRLALLNWIKESLENQDDLVEVIEKVELSHLEENATALVKNFSNLTEIKPFIKENYASIFSATMSRMSSQPEQWPALDSLQDFNRYFAIEIHTQLIHMF
ncbi:Uncharacterised protein [Fluoribacter dumoffii]|uniref:Uncharacterized protein n=2 Tax=Fluoribacter dumoffii TaxID=463 RepID=A0A377G7S0_9GAMM|nr:hypothetical protein Ldum_0759 [Fluoribacter dumoffii NY 23]STO20803.1 Uncharacterised protein [Fluoribacter dumoffii]